MHLLGISSQANASDPARCRVSCCHFLSRDTSGQVDYFRRTRASLYLNRKLYACFCIHLDNSFCAKRSVSSRTRWFWNRAIYGWQQLGKVCVWTPIGHDTCTGGSTYCNNYNWVASTQSGYTCQNELGSSCGHILRGCLGDSGTQCWLCSNGMSCDFL